MGRMRLKHPGGNVATAPLGVAHDESVSPRLFARSDNLNVLTAQRMEFVMNDHAVGVTPGIMWMVRRAREKLGSRVRSRIKPAGKACKVDTGASRGCSRKSA